MLNILQDGVLTSIQYETESAAMIAMVVYVLCSLLVPYLLGSINSAVLVSRLLYHEDIRTKGSGNAGLTNMHRTYGGRAALFVLLGDVLKTVLSLLIVGLGCGMKYGAYGFASTALLYLAGVACILGHIFPVYFRFKGGKGVLCTATMVLVLSPIVFLILFAVFVLLVLLTRYISVASMTVGLMYPFVLDRVLAFCGIGADILIMLSAILVALLIVYCHRQNIVRLWNREENKFSFKRKK